MTNSQDDQGKRKNKLIQLKHFTPYIFDDKNANFRVQGFFLAIYITEYGIYTPI